MSGQRSRGSRRRLAAARLAAAQALYQAEMTGAPADVVIRDFLDHGLGAKFAMSTPEDEDVEVEVVITPPDAILFAALVRGALERRTDLDAMIDGSLGGGWTGERLEAVLRAILRAGAFELSSRPDIPPKVSISEYVDVARAFYSGPEPGLVNAVLDRIARVVRTGEISGDARS